MLPISVIPSAYKAGNAACCTAITSSRPKGNNQVSNLSPLSECWSLNCTWCWLQLYETDVVGSLLLRIEEITVWHVTELATSLDIFCLQVLSSLRGCTFLFLLPLSISFPKYGVLNQSWKTAVFNKAPFKICIQQLLINFIFLRSFCCFWNVYEINLFDRPF